MKRYFATLFLVAAVVVLLLFVLFVINQTVQVVDLASRTSTALGTVVLWLLLAVYAAAITVPLTMFFRFPAPLRPPGSEDSPDFLNYLDALGKRLSANRHLSGRRISGRGEIEEAIAVLDSKADQLIKSTASKVFITTGISQSGRLDAILVLSAVSQMVWQIARLYYQRPSPREVIYLYGNVAATVFLATELQDIDVDEQLQPVLTAMFGSAVSTLPGTSFLVNSISTASGNAFLTLRIGAIAKRYCGAFSLGDRRLLRRAATAEAVRMFGAIVGQCTATISKAAWAVSKRKMGSTVIQTSSRIRKTARGLFTRPSSEEVTPDSLKKPVTGPADDS